ncbi:hypothetical protein BD626DRAFT_612896 [Schizophyllum amplum]|uniref:S1 motif domain-containing protein n=1 Tax=Schizophyllum amplum TaxID=97359 RepID=A0A550CMB4_9AGAR|nr:hypothetical protein BD626DRAFT_612896 [Auriculariopsis ampla]
MAAQKRTLEDSSSPQKSKKSKMQFPEKSAKKSAPQPASTLMQEEVDFPRGGGSSFTPLEVKAIRAEAVKEANDALFSEGQASESKKRKRKQSETKKASKSDKAEKAGKIRIEHLNYKRMTPGQKILGQIISIQPLALIISLPNQLLGHTPITNISTQLTAALDAMDVDESDEEDAPAPAAVPDLEEIFHPGQYVRAVVATVHAPGTTDLSGVGRSRDEVVRASRRVELSLVPGKVNAGVQKADLKEGFTLTAAVQSVEDHGYILDLGVPGVSGFLSFKDTPKPSSDDEDAKLPVGGLVNVTVQKLSKNGRICNVTADPAIFTSSCATEVTNVSAVLPGTLVQSLITAASPTGLNLQVLGFFDGTVDEVHLRQGSANDWNVGKKIKTRVLYSYSDSPPKLALALNEHIIALDSRKLKNPDGSLADFRERYPIGRVIENAKVVRVEPERGLIVRLEAGVEGFVHISHTSDEHIGSSHRARVTGYFPLDGLLQLSMKPSVLAQPYLQVADVQPGQVVKGTIKNLTEAGLFVSLAGNVDGVVWPNHYADITLKQPGRRFKVGATIKCRVLVVDEARKRISLTAKKSLLDSSLPVLARYEDAQVGMITHAVVFKVHDKHLMVEFYNNVKAIVPAKDAVESQEQRLADSFPVGKPVKVRITALEPEQRRIVASIRQAAGASQPIPLTAVDIGDITSGVVSEVHKEHALLTLQPSGVRALVSLANVAMVRNVAVAQLRTALQPGETLDELVVVERSPEKGFVIVSGKPAKSKKDKKEKEATAKAPAVTLDTAEIGQVVTGRVTRHVRQGALIKVTAKVRGILHLSDLADDFDKAVVKAASPLPPVDAVVKAAVVGVDRENKQLVLSTRPSRVAPQPESSVVDKEVGDIGDLHVGQTVRGFIKSVADHGLFVTVGRGLDARVQIKELFDDYVKEWKPRFNVNQVVQGRILQVDAESKKIEMSFRSEEALKSSTLTMAISKRIQRSKLKGLCRKTEGFRAGDKVKACILKLAERRIALSLKPSRLGDAGFVEDEEAEDDDDDEEQDGIIADVDAESDDEAEALGAEDESDDDGLDGEQEELDDDDDKMKTPLTTITVPRTTRGFQWNTGAAEPESDAESSDSDSETEQPERKKKKRRKEIEQDLTADMHTKAPESTADFERLLLGSPNSSYLWIQYMSFQLQLGEVDKARAVARRALQTINFREENEKLNTLDTTFKEAARANDSKTVHLRLAAIFEQSNKLERSQEQFKKTAKKFGHSSKAWTLYGEYISARKLLPRALQSLEKRKHIKTISKFAQLEYKMADPERGKTLFEGIVSIHPKRWDIWSIYMDMEAGQSNIQSLRFSQSQSFFKKWLELEHRLGDEAGADRSRPRPSSGHNSQ